MRCLYIEGDWKKIPWSSSVLVGPRNDIIGIYTTSCDDIITNRSDKNVVVACYTEDGMNSTTLTLPYYDNKRYYL